ncbi:hypothetical protein ACFY9Y_30605 [Streptomyces fimicarius]|uniref:hypothetical protein n=1 Tax=Streptomyces griseus TaxID=1911 RepID=UPI0036E9322A
MITADNVLDACRLEVAPEQHRFVSPVARSLAGEQGRGYGRFAVGAVNEEIRRRGGTVSTVTWKPGEGGPEEFHLGLGYRKRGLTDDGEYLGDLDLAAA